MGFILFSVFIYFIIFLLYKFLGFTNPTPFKRNLVLEISKQRMYPNLTSKHMHKQEP
jgi:hypothetical protein